MSNEYKRGDDPVLTRRELFRGLGIAGVVGALGLAFSPTFRDSVANNPDIQKGVKIFNEVMVGIGRETQNGVELASEGFDASQQKMKELDRSLEQTNKKP